MSLSTREKLDHCLPVPQFSINRLENAVKIVIDIAVPESKNFEALIREVTVTLLVARDVTIKSMLSAIDLDDHAFVQADKVQDVSIPRRLPADMKPALTPRAQMDPQFDLLRRHGFAQLSRAFVGHGPVAGAVDPTRPPLWAAATLPFQGRDGEPRAISSVYPPPQGRVAPQRGAGWG
jgi:hypothetical protein